MTDLYLRNRSLPPLGSTAPRLAEYEYYSSPLPLPSLSAPAASRQSPPLHIGRATRLTMITSAPSTRIWTCDRTPQLGHIISGMRRKPGRTEYNLIAYETRTPQFCSTGLKVAPLGAQVRASSGHYALVAQFLPRWNA